MAAAPQQAQAAKTDDELLGRLYGQGVHAFFDGEYAKAHKFLSMAIDAGSTDPRVYYFRGLALQKLGRPEAAEEDFATGGKFEAEDVDNNYQYKVAFALQRVQGSNRLEIETHRQQARIAERKRQREAESGGSAVGRPATTLPSPTPRVDDTPPADSPVDDAPVDDAPADDGPPTRPVPRTDDGGLPGVDDGPLPAREPDAGLDDDLFGDGAPADKPADPAPGDATPMPDENPFKPADDAPAPGPAPDDGLPGLDTPPDADTPPAKAPADDDPPKKDPGGFDDDLFGGAAPAEKQPADDGAPAADDGAPVAKGGGNPANSILKAFGKAVDKAAGGDNGGEKGPTPGPAPDDGGLAPPPADGGQQGGDDPFADDPFKDDGGGLFPDEPQKGPAPGPAPPKMKKPAAPGSAPKGSEPKKDGGLDDDLFGGF